MNPRRIFSLPLFGSCISYALSAIAIASCFVAVSFCRAQTVDKTPNTKKLIVSGAALTLFATEAGTPPEKVTLVDPLVIDGIEKKIASLWLVAIKVSPPTGLASSFHFDLKLSDGSKATLLAGRYCLLGGEWRESQLVKEVQETLVKLIPQTGQVRWSSGALNTAYPSDEEKLEILNRMISNSGERASTSNQSIAPSEVKPKPAKP